MKPSETTISTYLEQLHDANEIIQNSLLIGEQVSMISDIAHHYNQLHELITPAYYTDEEFQWCKDMAIGWNYITSEYDKQIQGFMTPDMQDNMDDLQDSLRDLFKGYGDNHGEDGTDCVDV